MAHFANRPLTPALSPEDRGEGAASQELPHSLAAFPQFGPIGKMKLITRSVFPCQAVAQIGFGSHLVENAIGIDNSRERKSQRADFDLLRDNLVAPPDTTEQPKMCIRDSI